MQESNGVYLHAHHEKQNPPKESTVWFVARSDDKWGPDGERRESSNSGGSITFQIVLRVCHFKKHKKRKLKVVILKKVKGRLQL